MICHDCRTDWQCWLHPEFQAWHRHDITRDCAREFRLSVLAREFNFRGAEGTPGMTGGPVNEVRGEGTSFRFN